MGAMQQGASARAATNIVQPDLPRAVLKPAQVMCT